MRMGKPIVLMMLAALFVFGLWLLKIELTYERNVRDMPAAYVPHRHTVTRLWKI